MSEARPVALIDGHVHLWDLTNNPWYPALQGPAEDWGLDDMSGMRRDFLVPVYREESSAFDVRKTVHVSAVSAPRAYLQEARWLERVADETGWPTALVGAVDPSLSPADVEADLQEQAASPRFRGVRVLTGLDPASATARALLSALDAGGWVFDLVAHPAEVPAYLPLLDAFPALPVVLEHAGWPDGTDADAFAAWKAGLVDLAAREQVVCKVSGLPMVTHSLAADALRPWIETCLELFGPGRCLFGSNFPVDALYGSFDQLVDSVLEITGGLSPVEREQFLVTTAERVYGI